MGILDRLFGKKTAKLIELLKDNNVHVQEDSAEALGKIGGERAVEALIQTFNDEYSLIRDKAIKALGMIGGEKAIKTLIQALKDEYTVVRVEAAEALGKIGDERAIGPLTYALKDENQYVRETAALALGKIKERKGYIKKAEAVKRIIDSPEGIKGGKFVVFIVTDRPSPLSSNLNVVKKLLNQCNISMQEGLEVIIDVHPEVARGEDMMSTIPFFIGRAKRISSKENLEYEIGKMAIQNFYSPELAVSGWIASIPMFRKT